MENRPVLQLRTWRHEKLLIPSNFPGVKHDYVVSLTCKLGSATAWFLLMCFLFDPTLLQVASKSQYLDHSTRPNCALWHDNRNDIDKRGVEAQASVTYVMFSTCVNQLLYSMNKKITQLPCVWLSCLDIYIALTHCHCCLGQVRWHQQAQTQTGPHLCNICQL